MVSACFNQSSTKNGVDARSPIFAEGRGVTERRGTALITSQHFLAILNKKSYPKNVSKLLGPFDPLSVTPLPLCDNQHDEAPLILSDKAKLESIE